MLIDRKPLRWLCVLLLLQVCASSLAQAQPHHETPVSSPPALSSEMAVELALKNSPQIQALMLEVGISQADVLQADRWPNPGFSLGVLQQGDERSLSQGFHFNLAKLFFKDELKKSASLQMSQSQKRLAAQLAQLTHETKKAFIEAVAAQENRRHMEKAWSVSQAGAELAQRMRLAGNFTKLQEAREQLFHANAAQALARAKRQESASLERLKLLMALPADHVGFTLPSRLPDLPDTLEPRENLEALALNQRWDVQLAKLNTEQLALSAGLTKATRFVNVLELGMTRQTSNLSPTEHGLQIGFELPLFDDGQARITKAHSRYMQSLQETAQLALNAQSQVREAHANYLMAYELAVHQRDVVLPLQQSMAEESMLRYNGMLIGVFDLLSDARMQISGTSNYLESVKYFWLAQVDLDMSLTGKPSLSSPTEAIPTSAATAAH